MNAQQEKLDSISNNLANVNTEGYTRQGVNLASVNYTSSAGRLAQVATLNIGQGVTVSGIKQYRDDFLDKSYRNSNSESVTWDTEASALKDVESIFDETKRMRGREPKNYKVDALVINGHEKFALIYFDDLN